MDRCGSFRRLEDVEREWYADPELSDAYRREVPYADVARAIIRLRARYKLSQSEFAFKAGRSQSYIARLESGKANVEVSTLAGFARAMGEHLMIDFRNEENRGVAPPL